MIIETNNQFDNIQNENNEKNKIKLYLEASLRRKVENFKVYLHKERKDLQRNEISYKVWLHSPEIIKDARNASNRSNEYGSQIKQKHEVIKFKLGLIDFEELKEQNQIYYSKNNGTKNEKEYYIVLAQIYMGKLQTHLMEEGSDPDKAISEISKFSSTEKSDCFYLCRDYSEVKQNKNDHWFALRDPSKMVYLALVKFTTEEELISCSGCSESKLDMKYCHNDKKYFCLTCDDDFHNKTSYNTLKKHRRTNYISFSVTYQGTCNAHSLKPYEFYCTTCKAIYCIRCLTDGEHSNNTEHEVRHLSELIGTIDQEAKTLGERVKHITKMITGEMEDKEKNSREVERTIQAYENDLYDRKRKAINGLDSETLARSTYLASLSIELQRMSSEIESKISFIRNQYANADNATYINMTNVFNKYMKEEVFHNIEMLVNLNLEGITQPFHKFEQKDKSEFNDRNSQK